MANEQKNQDNKKQNYNDDADREINGQGMSTKVQQNEKQEDIEDRKEARSPSDRKVGNQNNESEDPEVQV